MLSGPHRVSVSGRRPTRRRARKEIENSLRQTRFLEDAFSMYPVTGDWDAGLYTTVLPVTRAAELIPVEMAIGKFQGAITTATPRGSYSRWLVSPGRCSIIAHGAA